MGRCFVNWTFLISSITLLYFSSSSSFFVLDISSCKSNFLFFCCMRFVSYSSYVLGVHYLLFNEFYFLLMTIEVLLRLDLEIINFPAKILIMN